MTGINPITRSAAWVRASSLRAKARDLVRPSDAPRVHAGGAVAHRILLMGTGPAAGWGVESWNEALAGQLARALAEHTGRGIEVEVISEADMTAGSAPRAIEEVELRGFAAIVISLGFNEAIDLVYPGVWSAGLSSLVDIVADAAAPGTPILVLGVPPLSSLPHLSDRFSATVDAHAALLAESVADVVAHHVPLATDGWAQSITGALGPLLTAAR